MSENFKWFSFIWPICTINLIISGKWSEQIFNNREIGLDKHQVIHKD
jgi:hypothetical protein